MFAFEWPGDTPAAFEDISAFLRARAARIPELRRRLQEVPGNLHFPRWVRDDHIAEGESQVVRFAPRTWKEVAPELGELVQVALDARRSPWRIHVAPDVQNVPQIAGTAAVVVFQLSHAVGDGRCASRLSRSLFAPALDAVPASTSDADAPGSQISVALASLFALPYRLASGRVKALLARRAFARAHGMAPLGRETLRPAIRSNADPTPSRVAHMIPFPPGAFRRAGVTVTTLALTAVSAATDRYLSEVGDPTPETLNALVPMALPPDVEWPAANRLVNGNVDLFVGIADLAERAAAIRTSLSTARSGTADPLLTRWISAENMIPAPIYVALSALQRKRSTSDHDVPDTVYTNVTVASVDRGSGDIELCGARPVLTAGFPMLGPTRSISHGFYGIGDTVTACVTACPDTFPDHARYAEILEKAVADVVAATTSDI